VRDDVGMKPLVSLALMIALVALATDSLLTWIERAGLW
jgi:hypothetical protein